jgi:RNA polymerase sigma factor (sigma-70 family)
MKSFNFWSEVDLLHGIRNDDEYAIKTIYKLHFPMIENFVRQNGGGGQEAQDLFQDGFLVLYRNLKKTDFSLDCKIKTYIYSVCKRIWLTELKRKSKGPVVVDEIDEFINIDETELEDHNKHEDSLLHLEKSLTKLGEPCSTLLSDYYLKDLSMQQIATKMGYTNADNAKTQKYKCLLRLKKIFFENKVLNKEEII